MLTALLLTALAATPADSHADDRAALLKGVEELESVGVPGPVVAFGPRAFAVLTSGKGEAVVAAARHGRGRVVVFGHGGYVEESEGPGHARLLANALAWAAGGEDEPTVREVADGERSWDADVLVWGGGPLNPESRERVLAFVEEGGGLVVGQCPWGWQQLNPHKRLREDAPANRLVAPLGIAFGGSTLGGPFPVADSRADGAHAADALRELMETGKTSRFAVLDTAVAFVPDDDALFLPVVAGFLAERGEFAVPSEESPLRAGDAVARLQVAWWTRRFEDAPPEEVEAVPGVEHFPGAVPDDAERVDVPLRVDASTRGWISTGAYAAPGEVVNVRVRSGRPGGWSLRIGAHTDSIAHKKRWSRWPSVSRRFELGGRSTKVASSFGGLIYLEAERGAEGALELELEGVVAAPFFDLRGRDPEKAWRDERGDPAPWAEIAGELLILTVPSDAIRELEEPGRLARYWDAVVRTHRELAARPLPDRPERFVCDVQISAGYMHSGYPIMMHLDVTRPDGEWTLGSLVDVERLEETGHWGPFHELGHNHQRGWWTFAGTGEVTCNLFSLHAMEKVVGLEPWEVDWLVEQKPKAAPYLEKGAPYAEWKRSPGLALLMYAQVQREFGWEPFAEVFAEYEALSRSELPDSDDDKRDQWMVRLSRAVERDLGPFFERWGVPVSADARASVADLEPWMPDFADLER